MAFPLMTILAGAGMGAGLVGFFQPLSRGFTYTMNSVLANAIPTPADLITQYHREIIGKDEFIEKMRMNGFNEVQAERMLEASKTLLAARDLVILKWRKAFDEKDEAHNNEMFYSKMEEIGVDRYTANLYEQATLFYPNAADFIRFAVREVFKEDKVRKYGMDEEFPTSIVPYAAKTGMSEDVLKWYWRAHWELPSVELGMRMVNVLQPQVLNTKLPDGTLYGEKYKDFGIDPTSITTTYEDLSELLGMQDISPYWRDRIKALTFPPITRVDLRRLYELGIIEERELKARLLELGYSIKDAERMIEFYKAYKLSHEKDLTLTQIKSAFEYKEISREEALNMVRGLGYDQDESELIVSLWENKEYEDELKDKIAAIENMFKAGLIDVQGAITELDKLNIASSYRDKIISGLMLKRASSMKLPTKTDLEHWWKLGLIKGDEYKERMRQLGYREKDIELYFEALRRGV